MARFMVKIIYITLFISLVSGCIDRGGGSGSKVAVQKKSVSNSIKLYDYKVKAVYPHSTSALTQGLFVSNGSFIESTGEYGASTLRRVEMNSGKVLNQVELDFEYFGEGAVELNGKIYQLTWREGIAFVYDAKTLEKIKEFRYSGEGWGLATDGKVLYMSDGSFTIYKLDPESFKQLGSINVMANTNRVWMLNELEWIDGELWANVFMEDYIVKIDPSSGKVKGIINLEGILPEADRGFDEEEVLNGIAYDSISKKIYVTGKKWNKLFEIEISEK